MSFRVSLVFDDTDLSVGSKIFQGLKEKEVDVFCSHPKLIDESKAWGKSHDELLEYIYSENINFCIVLLSPNLVRRLRSRSGNTFYFVEAALKRNNFLLPIHLNSEVEHLPPYISSLYAPIINEEDHKIIIDLFLKKATEYQNVTDEIFGYDDVGAVISSYNDKLKSECISGKVTIGEKKIGYELYEVVDDFSSALNKYFLFLYKGAALSNTAEHLKNNYPNAFDSKALVILLHKEKGQKIYSKRKANVAEIFNSKNVFYIDEFLWIHCTKNRLLTGNEKFHLPQFIDPYLSGQEKHAVEYLKSWWDMPREPILVVKGSGGFGKTTLVKRFANTLIDSTNTSVLYLDSSEVTRGIRKNIDWYKSLDLYALYKAFCNLREEESIDKKLFRLNLDNGNITIIIDGIDEIIARLSSVFDLNAFVGSIYSSSPHVGDGKVILTCRNYFWDQANPDFQFDTVELLPFTRAMAQDYFASQFNGYRNLPQRAIDMADSLNRGNTQQCYIPFVLDIISNLLKNEIDDDDSPDPEFSSSILREDVQNDYILFKFCNRELVKLGADINVDDQVNIFIKFSVIQGSSILEKNAKEFFEDVSKKELDNATIKSLLAHPFFNLNENHLVFKYDFFEEHFNNIYIYRLIIDKELVCEQGLRTMRRYYRINSIFMEECVLRIGQVDDEVLLNMLTLIDKIKKIYLDNPDFEDMSEKAIAMVFNVAIQSLISTNSHNIENNTQMLKTFFASPPSSAIQGMSICGITYNNSPKVVFDFTDMSFNKCYLEEYDYFWECRFSKDTKFTRSKFLALRKKDEVSTTALLKNFDLDSCYLDEDCYEIAKNAKQKTKDKNVATVDDLRVFFRLFSGHGTFSKIRLEETIFAFRGFPNIPLKQFISLLVKEGVLEIIQGKAKKQYKIVDSYKHEIEQFVIQTIMSSTLKKIWENIRNL